MDIFSYCLIVFNLMNDNFTLSNFLILNDKFFFIINIENFTLWFLSLNNAICNNVYRNYYFFIQILMSFLSEFKQLRWSSYFDSTLLFLIDEIDWSLSDSLSSSSFSSSSKYEWLSPNCWSFLLSSLQSWIVSFFHI